MIENVAVWIALGSFAFYLLGTWGFMLMVSPPLATVYVLAHAGLWYLVVDCNRDKTPPAYGAGDDQIRGRVSV